MRYFALLVLSCLALPTVAMTNVDLYHANVAIDSEQEDGEALARRQGMEQVIVRASGDQHAAKNAVVEKALVANSRYISQLSYGEVDGMPSVDMRFNDEQIRALLTQAQLPFWAPERRSVLVWLVEEDGLQRKVVWDHSPSELAKQLRQSAQLRGLPITLPLGDFDDITSVEVSDLWGGFVEPISQVSRRYSVEAVLVVRKQGDNLRWTLYNQTPSMMANAMSTPLSGVASGELAALQLMNQLADQFAAQDAVMVSSESTESIDVTFLNVNTAKDFFNLENGLRKLNSVASLEILKIQGDELTLRVHLLASRQAFEQQTLQLPRVLKFVDPLGGEFTQPAPAQTVDEVEAQATSSLETTLNGEPAAETDNTMPVTDTTPVVGSNSSEAQAPSEPALPPLVFELQAS